jgi:hypothetical protein
MMLMLSGCAYLQTITDSKEFKAFCGWAPVAVSAVEAATVESAKDPSKKIATEAMGNAVLFLRLASAQCPVVTTP